MSFNSVQFINALSLIDVTVSGITIFSIDLHELKIGGILVIPSLKEMFFKLSHSSNTFPSVIYG